MCARPSYSECPPHPLHALAGWACLDQASPGGKGLQGGIQNEGSEPSTRITLESRVLFLPAITLALVVTLAITLAVTLAITLADDYLVTKFIHFQICSFCPHPHCQSNSPQKAHYWCGGMCYVTLHRPPYPFVHRCMCVHMRVRSLPACLPACACACVCSNVRLRCVRGSCCLLQPAGRRQALWQHGARVAGQGGEA